MIRLLWFGLCVGVGFQAWRNVPPGSAPTMDAAAFVFIVAVLAAYVSGRFHGYWRPRVSASATSTAVAVAEASSAAVNHVQLINVVPGAGAGTVGRSAVPTEGASWLGGDAPVLDVNQLEGFDLNELLDRETETHQEHT